MQTQDTSDRFAKKAAFGKGNAAGKAPHSTTRLTPTQKRQLAAFRQGLCGRFGRWYPLIAASAAAAALLLGFAPPSRAGDIAFLALFLFLLITLPSGLVRARGFAASLRAVRKKGFLDELLQDWTIASAHPEHEAALGERFVFSLRDTLFFTYQEIASITPGPLVYERRRSRQGCTLLVLRLTNQKQVNLGQCPKEPAAAYRAARERLEQALRQHMSPSA